ncbi:MAG: hypothetical protein AAGK37_20735 [Pseudomonadota bacterium]
MSLLVHYTLKSADDHAAQTAAMTALVADLKSEGIAGSDGLHYACFATTDPTKFVGILEFDSDTGKDAFLGSKAFATYRETVTPIFANPPEPSPITPIATTRAL